MEKSEMMKKFEVETGKQSAIVKFMSGGQALERKSYPKLGPYDYNMEYLAWLEAKAAAYDRLMSGGKKTLKEIANIFGSIVAMDESGRLHLFGMEPKINKNVEEWQPVYRSYYEKVPICDIDFNGDWKDSLTLPDGWEEKHVGR